MSTPETPPPQSNLNPELRRRMDVTHDTSVSSAAPVDTASVQRRPSPAWPIIWAVVTIGCVALAVWILFF
jgi:hypothetical protein